MHLSAVQYAHRSLFSNIKHAENIPCMKLVFVSANTLAFPSNFFCLCIMKDLLFFVSEQIKNACIGTKVTAKLKL